MTFRRRDPGELAHVAAFGFCRRDGEQSFLPGELALSTIDRPILSDAARRLRERLVLVESEIARRP